MKLAELKELAASLKLKGVSTMRKGELVAVIAAAQAGENKASHKAKEDQPSLVEAPSNPAPAEPAPAQPAIAAPAQESEPALLPTDDGPVRNRRRRVRRVVNEPDTHHQQPAADSATEAEVAARLDALLGNPAAEVAATQPVETHHHSEEIMDDRRGRRRRNRDRNNRQRGNKMEAEPTISEGDVLQEVSGILDVLDTYAFVRTNGYLQSPGDAYVSLSMVRKNGLRKGDIITGAIRAGSGTEQRGQKYQPLVRIDTVNGDDPAKAKDRPEFAKLTPLYPQEQLRLETTQQNMTGRIIDLVSPIGKGQRGLIVSPPKAGKTMVMQSIANSITTNNPEVHLMVVLVDERPEEVTDFQRSVQGEVIASTFDRPAEDHTMISELAIERAKRLVEYGKDVVILLDGITRLSRAYNLAAPASGRILSGGVDSAALYPPKKFFGAARNVEGGGSLTILATALVETGSKMDEVIFEEFKGTGNMELRLRRDLADKRLFPAIDLVASGTRREEWLLGGRELAIIWKLRRVLAGLDPQAGLEMLLTRMRKTHSNAEFLVLISRTTPNPEDGR
ncbi:MAG: transcription termination factor Rho [Propionibacteriaceae bacterium]|jgi:transcription termination factor Rho|nr:transcription termination factor Rho [Propionibacteriaceae bacterium]